MTNTIATQTTLRLKLGLAFALAAACDEAGSPPETDASFRVLDMLVIDDFETGPVQVEIDTVDQLEVSQHGAGILGGSRCLDLSATVNPYDRPVSVEVRDGEGGYLALESGVGVHQSMMLLYGYDDACNSQGLAADFSPYTHLRLEFAPLDIFGAIDQGVGGAIVVWSSAGAGSGTLSIDAQTQTHDVALADFDGDVDWSDVQEIAVVMQSGGAVPGHDYILQSFSAVALEQ
jgi:hypothetical protein